MKKKLTGTWFTQDNEMVIDCGKALRDIENGELLVSYDKLKGG